MPAMPSGDWTAIDRWFAGHLVGDDPVLDAVLARAEAGLPAHQVSPLQGRLLQLLALAAGARRILEIGTLGGYSTVWLARAVAPDGRIVTIELDPERAAVARDAPGSVRWSMSGPATPSR
jgi:predicted O-methyltransferase YrrM